jgi:hypothetical protein
VPVGRQGRREFRPYLHCEECRSLPNERDGDSGVPGSLKVLLSSLGEGKSRGAEVLAEILWSSTAGRHDARALFFFVSIRSRKRRFPK